MIWSAHGYTVAEGDGWLDPPLSAWAGYAWDRMALLGSLGLAATNTVTLQSSGEDEVDKTRLLIMAIRPGADLRYYLAQDSPVPSDGAQVRAWTGGGLYLVLPVVQYRSDSFTDEEQAAYDELAEEDRARILGGGARAFVGAEHVWDQGIGLGFQSSWGLHRAADIDDSVIRVSWRTQVEASLLLSFWF
jgi:hypothetical protein